MDDFHFPPLRSTGWRFHGCLNIKNPHWAPIKDSFITNYRFCSRQEKISCIPRKITAHAEPSKRSLWQDLICALSPTVCSCKVTNENELFVCWMGTIQSGTRIPAFPHFLLYSTVFAHICLYWDYLSIPPCLVSHSSLYHSHSLATLFCIPSVSFSQWLTLLPSNCLSTWIMLYLVCVWACVCVCSVPIKACYYTPEKRRSTFHWVTGVFASPAHLISCIICILLASISQCAICFCHTPLYFLTPSFLSFTIDPSRCDETPWNFTIVHILILNNNIHI